MKGKANPFANLLTKLATKPNNAQNGSEDKDGEEDFSQSDVDYDDKDKESQSDDEDESDKQEQEIDSTTTEEEQDFSKSKRNLKDLLVNIKDNEEMEKELFCKINFV